MKCPKCQKRVKNEKRKEQVCEMIPQQTTALDYTMYLCCVCKHKEFVKQKEDIC